MAALIATLPVQLACQLICAGNYSPNNFTLATVDTQLPKETTVLPDGFTPFPDIGVAYRYFGTHLTWYAARKACIAHDGNLAVIDSFKKMNYVNSLKDHPHNAGMFMGIHRLFGNGEWVSVKTGLPVRVIPWAPETYAEDQGRNCLAAWHDGRGLSAIPCHETRHIVCEIPLSIN